MEGNMEPLRDIRVLAVTVYLAGPFCAMNLARMGAEVITVEMPGRGNPARGIGAYAGPKGNHPVSQTDQDLSTMFLKRAQGVKSVTLNLKHLEGRDMLLKLAESCDIFLENLAPGSMMGMGLGYSEVSQVNPGIIYCSISGYGQEGPYANKRAHDPQIQGMSGLMDINGEEDGSPIRVGFLIGDLVTPLFACYSIMAALREKDRTGRGQHLDVSMMDTLVSLMFMENLEERIEDGLPLRTGNFTRSGPTGLYRASDGDLVLTASGDDQWTRLARALDAPELTEDPRFATGPARDANLEEARQAVQRLIGAMTVEQALERLEAGDVPCGPVRTAAEVMADPHFWERGTLQPMRHGALEEPVKGVGAGFPVLFSGGPLPELAGAPILGMHNNEVYGRLLGLGEEELRRLGEEGVV
jgi:formyl-CoA transferase